MRSDTRQPWRRGLIFGCSVAAAVSLAVAAPAVAATTYSSTATGTPSAGSKKAPAPFGGSWTLRGDAGAGIRPATPVSWAWAWEGVVVKPQGFPTCTAAQIDAAQSDSVCPRGSRVGGSSIESIAQFGPAGDPTSNLTCTGKEFNFYNAGPGKMVIFLVGPPDQCGGIDYLAPVEMSVTTKNKSSTMKIEWLPNITNPLPGLKSSLNQGGGLFNVVKTKVKKKGKTTKSAYLQSVGCGGATRDFTFTIVDEEAGSTAVKTSAGKCKQAKKK